MVLPETSRLAASVTCASMRALKSRPFSVRPSGMRSLRLAVGVEPHVPCCGLVVAVPIAALAALEVVVPSQRRVIRLLVHDPAQLAVGDRLAEVVARLHRDHGLAALHDEARGRRDDHLELRLAILLHLEAAGRLRVAALDRGSVVAERRGGRHRERRRAPRRSRPASPAGGTPPCRWSSVATSSASGRSNGASASSWRQRRIALTCTVCPGR